MDQPLLVGVAQAPGELDGNVEDPFQDCLRTPLVEFSCANPILKTAALDVLGEDARDAAETAHVVATDGVGVESELDPGLRLALEVLRASGFGQDVGPGA